MICIKKKLSTVISWSQLCHICNVWCVSAHTSTFHFFFFPKPISKSTKQEAKKKKKALCDGSIINLLWQTDRFIAAHHRFSRTALSSVGIWSFVTFHCDTVRPHHRAGEQKLQNESCALQVWRKEIFWFRRPRVGFILESFFQMSNSKWFTI